MSVETHVYDRVSQLLHWTLAVLILFLIVYHPETEHGETPSALEINLHASVGLCILLLILVRIVWHFTMARIPAAPHNLPAWHHQVRTLAHRALYVLMLLTPVLGVVLAFTTELDVALFGVVDIPSLFGHYLSAELIKDLHGFGANLLLSVVILHVAVALYHHFVLRDGLLRRMYRQAE